MGVPMHLVVCRLHGWESHVKILVVFTVWCILLVLCWPLALVVVVLAPLLWLVALPFRIVGICFAALFAFVKALLFLPARVIGYRG
jgi:hypothetical protein